MRSLPTPTLTEERKVSRPHSKPEVLAGQEKVGQEGNETQLL